MNDIKKINVKRNAKYFFGLTLYKISLDIVYIFFVVPYYSYIGLNYAPSFSKYIIGMLFFIIISIQTIKTFSKNRPSRMIVLMINLIYFLPGITYYSFSAVNTNYFILFSIYSILFNFWNNILPFINFELPKVRNRRIVFRITIVLIALGALFIVGKYNNFRLHFNLFKVYDLRAIVREMNLPGIVGYFRPVATSIIPIGAVYYLKRKKFIIFLLLVFIQLLLFAFGGHKTTIFILIVAILAVLILKKDYINKTIPSLTLINIIAIIEGSVKQDLSTIAAYIHRRNMFTTNSLSYLYYDYFSKNHPDYLRQSILRHLGFGSTYNIPIHQIISEVYFGGTGGANNGMVGDAFANFGWACLLIYPLMFAIVFRFFDYCTIEIDEGILFVVSVIFTINFVNSSFFTVMGTHGFLVITMFLYFLPKETYREINRKKGLTYGDNFKKQFGL